MTFRYKWADVEDLPSARQFVGRTFGADSIQAMPGRLAWIGFDHPTGVHAWLVSRGESVVAMCCHIPAAIFIGGDEVGASFAVDLMVESDSRRQGIGRESLRQRCLKYGVSLSTGQSVAMAGLYAGQEDRCCLAVWRRALFVRRLKAADNLRWTVREVVAFLAGRFRFPVAGSRDRLGLDEAVALLNELPPRFAADEAGLRVSAAHFRWRYGGPVYRDYSFFRLRSRAGEHGLLVTRQSGDTEYAADLFCAPEARRNCFRLAGETTPGSRLVVECAGRRLTAALRRAGYLVRPGGGEIVALSDNWELLNRLALSAWCAYAGESDVDLIRMNE